MKPIWKWVIGIVAGLAVLALLVGAAFAFRNASWGCYGARAWDGLDRMPGRAYGLTPYVMPRAVGMIPFGGFLGGLIRLGVLALIVLGIVWLARGLRAPAAPPAPAAVCGNCGKPVEVGWRNCPYCGKKL